MSALTEILGFVPPQNLYVLTFPRVLVRIPVDQ